MLSDETEVRGSQTSEYLREAGRLWLSHTRGPEASALEVGFWEGKV